MNKIAGVGGGRGGQSAWFHSKGGGGGYGTDGTSGGGASDGAGGAAYGSPALDDFFLGAGGGASGYNSMPGSEEPGDPGGPGGGGLFIIGQTINFGGTLSAKGDNGVYMPGGGAGGSIRIEGGTITLNSLVAAGGTRGGLGCIAIYYSGAQPPSITTSNPAPYLAQMGAPTATSTPTSTSTALPTSTPRPSWVGRTYHYEGSQPHAVTSVISEQLSAGSYQYDANGNMTCRAERGAWFIQGYNDENRIASISRLDGRCGSGNILESWFYQYDGDGVRVEGRYFVGAMLTSMKACFIIKTKSVG